MSELEKEFTPALRPGLIIHIAAGAFLSAGSAFCFWAASRQAVGLNFLVLLLLALLFLVPLPLVLYRGYALVRARYIISRDMLNLSWGLRVEEIPLTEIEWIRAAVDTAYNLPLPRLSWPGALLGERHVDGLGPIEYLAASTDNLLLIATPQKIYAISPSDPAGFVRAFQTSMEMGSLTRVKSYSARPAAYLRNVWDSRAARVLILAGLASTLVLFILVSLIIPTRATVSLGYNASGQPLPPVPRELLLLWPVLGSISFGINLLAGLFLFRISEQQVLAYLLWTSSGLTSFLLILAVFFLK
jgi:hypothetical protein